MQPSTGWAERIDDGEEQRFAAAAKQLVAIQQARVTRYGKGRALHRKQVLGLRATLETLPGLPAYAAQGLFAAPRSYDAWVRISNGSVDVAADRKPDIRGLAIKVLGVEGEGVFGGAAPSQDFLLINHSVFGFARPEAFFGVVFAAADGLLAVVKHFVKTHGFVGGLRQLAALQKVQSSPFAGFAAAPFFSAAPIACGQHAARVRLLPEGAVAGDAPRDFAADLTARLARAPLRYQLQLQFFVDEQRTPIEDGSVDWSEADAPYVTVARLTIPQQDLASPEGKQLAGDVEATKFDPWSALAAHRPLGAIMRARKVAYLASQKARGAA